MASSFFYTYFQTLKWAPVFNFFKTHTPTTNLFRNSHPQLFEKWQTSSNNLIFICNILCYIGKWCNIFKVHISAYFVLSIGILKNDNLLLILSGSQIVLGISLASHATSEKWRESFSEVFYLILYFSSFPFSFLMTIKGFFFGGKLLSDLKLNHFRPWTDMYQLLSHPYFNYTRRGGEIHISGFFCKRIVFFS